jgi:uncharacterized protein
MNIIVDITHPAHVHFFRHAIGEWNERNHNLLIVTRDKDLTLPLLEYYGYQNTCLSRPRQGMIGFAKELIEHESKLFKLARKFKADVIMGIGGAIIVHAGKLLGIPTIVFNDTEHAKISHALAYPFATKICTPDCYMDDLGSKHVRYAGYHELAYLHPNRFTPDLKVLEEIGITPDQKYFLVRFVSWEAVHDVGKVGFSYDGKRRLVESLSKLGRVIITSESKLPKEFEQYRMRIPPTKIHDLLNFSALYIGEGGTMASEAAILGVPGIYVNPLYLGYLQEQETKYGLVYNLPDETKATELALALACNPTLHVDYKQKRQALLDDKIDVTAWMVEFVENINETRDR